MTEARALETLDHIARILRHCELGQVQAVSAVQQIAAAATAHANQSSLRHCELGQLQIAAAATAHTNVRSIAASDDALAIAQAIAPIVLPDSCPQPEE